MQLLLIGFLVLLPTIVFNLLVHFKIADGDGVNIIIVSLAQLLAFIAGIGFLLNQT